MSALLAILVIDPRSIPIDQLAQISGDVSGVRVPELAPACGAAGEDPVTHIRCKGNKGGAPRGLREAPRTRSAA